MKRKFGVLVASVVILPLILPVAVEAAGTVVVPNVYNTCGDTTDQIIKRAGLKPKAIPVHGGNGLDWGCAYEQTPKAGKKVKKGSTVRYKYGWEAG